jgi:filamentous hemagglutinin family protein
MWKNLSVCLFLLTLNSLTATAAKAQINPDSSLGTENSQVTGDPSNTRIEGGAIRGKLGQFLFHSFQDFNINNGQSVYFANPANIQTIFSRVTGNNPSLILGHLGVEGNANLFFMNPNGILFGSGATFDLNGAFVATTANKIKFPDGSSFGTTDSESAPPLLTIETPTPVGLEFASNKLGSIVNESPLAIDQNLTLAGGTIASSGDLSSLNGNLSLVTVPQGFTSLIQLDENGSYLQQENQPLDPTQIPTSPSVLSLADLISVSGESTGFVVNSSNQVNPIDSDITIQDGDIAFSGFLLSTGIYGADVGTGGNIKLDSSNNINVLQPYIVSESYSNSNDTNPGDITLAARGKISLNNTTIETVNNNFVTSSQAGNIFLIGQNGIELNASSITVSTFSPNSVGSIGLNTNGNGDMKIDNGSFIQNNAGGENNVGNVSLSAKNIFISNGSNIQTTFNFSNIKLAAVDNIILENESYIQSFFESKGTSTIYLSGQNLSLKDGSYLQNYSDSYITEDADKIDLNFQKDIQLIANSYINQENLPQSQVAGDINIKSNNLFLQENAFITNINDSLAKNGKLTISLQGDLNLDNGSYVSQERFIDSPDITSLATETDIKVVAQNIKIQNESRIYNLTDRGDEIGRNNQLLLMGNIDLFTKTLELSNNSQISSDALGNLVAAGTINIESSERVRIDNFSQIGSNISEESQGNPGAINIKTPELFLLGNSQIVAEVETGALAGIPSQINIEADRINLSQSQISTRVNSGAEGSGGDISIQADNLNLEEDAKIVASTSGKGNAGNINLLAKTNIFLKNGSQIASEATTEAEGNGGNITIETPELRLSDRSIIATNSMGESMSNAGKIDLTVEQLNLESNSQIAATTSGGAGGNINIQGQSFTAKDNSQILTTTAGQKQAGDINLTIADNITLTGSGTGLFADSSLDSAGSGGNIFVRSNTFRIANGAGTFVNSRGTGTGGSITIGADRLVLDRGQISAETASSNGGNINIKADNVLLLRNRSQISANAGTAQSGGNGGNINIESPFIIAFPQENSDITANAFLGNGGNIAIATNNLFGIEPRPFLTPLSDITASSTFGLSGTIGLKTLNVDPLRGLENLPISTVNPQVSDGCQPQTERSQTGFYNLGSSGLPVNPNEYRTGEAKIEWVPWLNIQNSHFRVNRPEATAFSSDTGLSQAKLPCQ